MCSSDLGSPEVGHLDADDLVQPVDQFGQASRVPLVFVVAHKMSRCALLTAVKNYNKSPEKLQDFFFKTKTKTKCSRPRLHDPRPRLSFLSSRRLETKTLVSRTTSLLVCYYVGAGMCMKLVECALLMKCRLGLEELELIGGPFSCKELVSVVH